MVGGHRRGGRRPAHAMPSMKRTKRAGIRNPKDRARHTGDARLCIAEAFRARPALAEIQTSRIPELDIALLATRSSVRYWATHAVRKRASTRAVRKRVFKVAMISCLVPAGILIVGPPRHPTDRSSVRGTTLTPSHPTVIAPSLSGSRLNAGKQPLNGAAPQTGNVVSKLSEEPGHDLSIDTQGLPAAPDDPDLEAALSDLDRQADLDQSMRRQHGLGEPPPVPTTGSPVAQPGGEPPGT